MWTRQMSPTRFRITLDTPQRTFIASSQPALPGWRVRVNGRTVPIHRVNGAFIGFFVPAGKVRVAVEYRPATFYVSLVVSLIMITGIFIVHRYRGGRKRRQAAAFQD
jgi:uncharacterized membrane protein YfhO